MADQQAEINSNLFLFENIYNKIPDNWNSYNDFQKYLMDIFSQYLSMLPSFKEPIRTELEKYNPLPKQICSGLLLVVKYYLTGKHNKAYLHMLRIFNDVKSILVKRSLIPSQLALHYAFRGRNISETNKPITREDLFHIPFQKRHLVSEHRFSHHGIPALYLGSSIIDCYTELNLTNINDFWVSLFMFQKRKVDDNTTQDTKLIDLTVAPFFYWFNLTWSRINQNTVDYNNALQSIVGDILLWPLIRACTIICKYPDAPFQQEYIIPKLLFQICSESTDFIGIKYQSTRTKLICSEPSANIMHNIAFPARKIANEGYCSVLRTQLIMSDPVNIKMIDLNSEIHTEIGITRNGLPILAKRNLLFQDNTLIKQFDQITLYFENMLDHFPQEVALNKIAPLYGWV